MDCKEVREQFSVLLDGELAPEERAAVETHLSACSDCLRELDGLKRVDQVFKELPVQRAPADFEVRVQGALRPRVFRLARARLSRQPLWPMLSAAAAFVMIAGLVVWQVQFMAQQRRFNVAEAPAARGQAEEPTTFYETEYSSDSLGIKKDKEEALSERDLDEGQTSRRLTSAASDTRAENVGAELQKRAYGPLEAKPAAPPKTWKPLEAPPADKPYPAASAEGVMAPLSAARESEAMLSVDVVAPTGAAKARSGVRPSGLADTSPRQSPGDLAMMAEESQESREKAAAHTLMGFRVRAKERPDVELTIAQGITEEPAAQARDDSMEAKVVTRQVADRQFVLRDGVWEEEGYRGQPTKLLERGSKVLDDLTREHPGLADVLALGERGVFRLDEIWYRVEPAADSR